MNRTHGMHKTKTYFCWGHMKSRCLCKTTKNYFRYGGRGITICKRWLKFENFFEDMGEKPHGLTLERINNNKGYSKSNCVWATPKQQANNRSNNRKIRLDGKVLTVTEWANKKNIRVDTLWWRIKNGWSASEAIMTPLCKKC